MPFGRLVGDCLKIKGTGVSSRDLLPEMGIESLPDLVRAAKRPDLGKREIFSGLPTQRSLPPSLLTVRCAGMSPKSNTVRSAILSRSPPWKKPGR